MDSGNSSMEWIQVCAGRFPEYEYRGRTGAMIEVFRVPYMRWVFRLSRSLRGEMHVKNIESLEAAQRIALTCATAAWPDEFGNEAKETTQ